MKGIIDSNTKKEKLVFTEATCPQESIEDAYSKWGTECPRHIDGSFSFVIYDKENDLYFGARDRFGVIPFYYSQNKDRIIFSSDLNWLSKQSGVDTSPDDSTVFDYLIFNRTDNCERTFFNGIKKLMHGHYFIAKDGIMEIHRWYDLKEAVDQAKPYSNPEEYRRCLTNVISKQLGNNQEYAVSLSGGLDSSTIASIIVKTLGQSELNTYSAVYNSKHRSDESEYIKEFEPIIKNMHYAYPTKESLMEELNDLIETQVEPCPTFSPYAQYKVLELAKDQANIVFDGQGADEEMAGYSYAYGFYFKELFIKGQFRKLVHEMWAYYKVQHSLYCIKTFAYFLLVPNNLKTFAKSKNQKDISIEFYRKHKNTSSLARDLYGASSLKDALIDHFEHKLEHLLKWGYNNAQRWGLRCYQPFLAAEIVERTLATDNGLKLRDGYSKYIMREAMKGILPEKIRLRTDKVGFSTPQDEWLKSDPLKAVVEEIIYSESFASRPYFNVRNVQKMYIEHCNGTKNHSKSIWKWINLELWLRKYSTINHG